MLILASSCVQHPPQETPSRLEVSRQIVSDYAQQLQSELMGAMQTGGPVSAINVCKERAPNIAQKLSRSHGAVVMRTSLRMRNPDNSPDSWQNDALKTFKTHTGPGDEPAEFFETTRDGGALYMKPIYTKPLCLVCHGESLSADVKKEIDGSYPMDKATGYGPSELRGAFSVRWPPTD